jgi:spore coat-associated protein N
LKIQMSIGQLGAISTGLLLVGVGSTFAFFTDTATNSSNTLNAGKVQIQDVTGKAAFSQTLHFNNLAPGDSETANVSVQNTGNLDAWVYLDGPASSQTESGALFQGAHPLAITFDSNPLLLHPGETKPLSVSYSLPRDAGNEYQNASGTMNIVIDAVQARDNTNQQGTGPSTPIPTGSGTGGTPNLAEVQVSFASALTGTSDGYTFPAGPVTATMGSDTVTFNAISGGQYMEGSGASIPVSVPAGYSKLWILGFSNPTLTNPHQVYIKYADNTSVTKSFALGSASTDRPDSNAVLAVTGTDSGGGFPVYLYATYVSLDTTKAVESISFNSQDYLVGLTLE